MNLQNLDWALWPSFLAILRESSLSGAARALGVAHPTVRRHLDELEAWLGAPLFVRSPSGLVLSALKARHPGLSFELTLSNRIEDLLRHDADIAVRMTRPAQEALVARKVGLIPLGLYAHESWIARQGEPVSLADLIASGYLIGYDRDPGLIRALVAHGSQVASADFGFRSDNDLAQLSALRAGFGVGICQQPIAARDPMLRRVLPAFAHALEIWLVTHPNLRNVRRVRATLDGLASGLAGHVASATAQQL